MLAQFLQMILASALLILIPNPTIGLIASVGGGALIYFYSLDTTIVRGFLVSLLAGLTAAAIVVLAAGSLIMGQPAPGQSPV